MEAFDVLGDPVRRRLIELIAEGERAAGERLMRAIERVTADKRFHTPDLGGKARTADVTAAVIDAVHGANA